jgi:hypothetical protein
MTDVDRLTNPNDGMQVGSGGFDLLSRLGHGDDLHKQARAEIERLKDVESRQRAATARLHVSFGRTVRTTWAIRWATVIEFRCVRESDNRTGDALRQYRACAGRARSTVATGWCFPGRIRGGSGRGAEVMGRRAGCDPRFATGVGSSNLPSRHQSSRTGE